MGVMMIRAKVKPEVTADVEAAAQKMFAAINAARPDGVRYAACRLPDGETFVVLLALDGDDNSLAVIPEFQQFQGSLRDWLAEPPTPEQLTVVGSYNLF
jgi:hypothetical protein